MSLLPTDCIYDILLLLKPKELLLCSQINNDFKNLSSLESLWKIRVNKKFSEIFPGVSHYNICKRYYALVTLRKKLKSKYLLQDVNLMYSLIQNKQSWTNQHIVELMEFLKYIFGDNRIEDFPKEIYDLARKYSNFINRCIDEALIDYDDDISSMMYSRIIKECDIVLYYAKNY